MVIADPTHAPIHILQFDVVLVVFNTFFVGFKNVVVGMSGITRIVLNTLGGTSVTLSNAC